LSAAIRQQTTTATKLSPPLFCEVRIMSSLRYRKLGEDCLERAVRARKSEDSDAWLLIAKDWLLLAAEYDAAKQQSGTSPQR